jgi:hypothetical protein
VGDLNADGNSDLVVGDLGASTINVLIGNGLGSFAGPTSYTVGIHPASVAIGDFNGDNKPDLAVGDYNASSLNILLNSGVGTFGTATSFPTGGAPSYLAAADLNGDLAIDLAVADAMVGSGVNGALAVLLNTCGSTPLPPPALSINDMMITEGDTGTMNATFTVTLSAAHNQTVSVSYSAKGITATAGVDFQANSGRVKFDPGQTSRTVSIPIIGDPMDEFDETFTVSLLSPVNAPIGDRQGIGLIVDNDPPPNIAINDVSVQEGDTGQANATFTVTLSAISGKPIAVQYSAANGSAIAGSDYVAASGTVTIPPGSLTANIQVQVIGDAIFEPDETFLVNIAADNATPSIAQGTGTILNDDVGFRFNSTVYSVSETGATADLTVLRVGRTSGAVSVDYATSDSAGANNCATLNGNASSRCDYEAKFGSLRFASGETSKTLNISLVDDAYAEGNESFTVNLNNAVGGNIDTPASATVTITDNDSANGANPIDQAAFFVRQHYIDFLNREPDPAGLAFWTNQITECSEPGATCSTEVRRINVSAAFFLSIEFQETGYLAYKFYKSAYGNLPSAPVPVRYEEFLPDMQKIGDGVIVGVGNWETQLENNKQAYAASFVTRSRFVSAYPTSLTPAQFVDRLYLNAGVASPPDAERTAAINEFGGAGNTLDTAARARALRRVAENGALNQQELNRAFVLMQYFGYLRRNPYDPPEATLDYQGYNFWLGKLNQFNGNFVNAEMVKAFLISGEYRQRFAQ